MSQLLIMGAVILAQEPFFTITDDNIIVHAEGLPTQISEGITVTVDETIYPKHVIDGWQIVYAVVPDGFTPNAYTWDGSQVVAKPPVVTPPVIPISITMRQARLALLGAGLLSNVNSAIAAMTGAAGTAAQIEWEYSSDVLRNEPLTLSMGAALGLTSAQIDTLFIQAATL